MPLDDYVDVAARIAAFKEIYPDGTLQPFDPFQPFTRHIAADGTAYLVYTAAAYRSDTDTRPAIGIAWETESGSGFTKGSELMVLETSAWGRALVALGIPSKKVASAEEIAAARQRSKEADPWTESTPLKSVSTKSAFKIECPHGERNYVKKDNWAGYFCPLPKGDPDACEPKWEAKAKH
jgi:hypothetical protein